MGVAKPAFPVLQRGHTLAQGVLGSWAMQDGYGLSASDAGPRLIHGTLTNGTSWAGTPYGWGTRYVAASSQTVQIATTRLPVLTAYTWFVVALSPHVGDTSGSQQVMQFGSVSDSFGFSWQHGSSSFASGAYHQKASGGGYKSAQGPGALTLSANTWYGVAATWDGIDKLTFFVNGVPGTAATAVNNVIATSGNVQLGGQSGVYWDGTIALFALWDRALSPAELGILSADPAVYLREPEAVFPHSAAPPPPTVTRGEPTTAYAVKQAQTAQPLLFLMKDSTDHVSPKTGLTPTVTLSKNGAAFGAPVGAVAEVGSGLYKVAGNATDAGTLGPLALHATAAGADPSDTIFSVVAYDPQSASLGLANIPANVAQWNGAAVATPTVAGVPKVDTSRWRGVTPNALTSGRVDASTSGTVTVGAYDAAVQVDGMGYLKALGVVAAMVGGKNAGVGSGTETFVGLNGSTTRAVLTLDADGNCTAVSNP